MKIRIKLKSDAMAEIERVLSVSGEEITGIDLKKGITNRSFYSAVAANGTL